MGYKNKPKIAVIGTTPISQFHVTALRKAGFEVCGVAASAGSKTVADFAARHDIPQVWETTDRLIQDYSKWDGLLIASATSSVFPLLVNTIEIGKPILAEKPVAVSAEKLKIFEKNPPANVIVGYNRRHYNTVIEAKKFVDESRGIVSAKMCLPEVVNSTARDPLKNVRSNSVHGLDMLRFIFGELSVVSNQILSNKNDYLGRFIMLQSVTGAVIHLSLTWNSSENFSLSISNGNDNIELKPFEMFSHYRGLNVIEPTAEYPLRQYIPKKLREFNVFFNEIEGIKPGFYGQAKDFMNLFLDGKDLISADLRDAYRTMSLLENII